MSLFDSISASVGSLLHMGAGSTAEHRPPLRDGDPGRVVGHSTDPTHRERPAPPGPEARADAARQGLAWDDDRACWVLADSVDPSDVAAYGNPGVEVHDHSHSNPSTWTIEDWKAAFKRDPEKYTRLFQELATTPDGLSQDVQDHKAEMNNLVATVVQDFNRDMTLLKSLIDANHETQKQLAQFRV